MTIEFAMSRLAIVIISAAILGFAAGAWYFAAAPGPVPGGNPSDLSPPLENRVAALERSLVEERQARQLLQDELLFLTAELERIAAPESGTEATLQSATGEDDGGSQAGRPDRRSRFSVEARVERLLEAGFLPGQAEWIARREQELQMQALRARFEAERSGEPIDWMENRSLAADTLRDELGDADYERYLEASGRSTSVSVSSVIESSPAQAAGFKPGDEIVRYDGERVFSMTDLTRQTMAGEPGENIIVDVMRDGNLVQIVMPRGPVGITGGRRRF